MLRDWTKRRWDSSIYVSQLIVHEAAQYKRLNAFYISQLNLR